MRLSKRGIVLSWNEFREASHDDICKSLGIYRTGTDDWVDDEANAKAEQAIRSGETES